MLHLVQNGSLATTMLQNENRAPQAIEKCLRFLKNVLKIDCRLAKFNSSSSTFLLLQNLAQNKDFIELDQASYLSVYKSNGALWGFIEITPQSSIGLSLAQIKKARQAIKDILEPELIETFERNKFNKNYSIFILESDFESGHRVATGLFYNKKFTSFINLSEWLENTSELSLQSLRDFQDSLLFIPEVLNITRSQRAALALYELLPEELKSSSLFICTSATNYELEKNLSDEKGFLSAFEDSKALFHKNLETRLKL